MHQQAGEHTFGAAYCQHPTCTRFTPLHELILSAVVIKNTSFKGGASLSAFQKLAKLHTCMQLPVN